MRILIILTLTWLPGLISPVAGGSRSPIQATDEGREAIRYYQAPHGTTVRGERFTTPTPAAPAIMNPPGFRWEAQAHTGGFELQLARDSGFTEGTILYSGLSHTVFTPDIALDEGKWYWRFRDMKPNGERGPWSETYPFFIDKSLPRIPVPPAAELVRQLEELGRPRLYVTADTLPLWRKRIQTTHRRMWQDLASGLDNTRSSKIVEPASGASNMDVNHAVRPMADGMALLALNHLLTGERRDGELAREALLQVMGWDPDGSTSRFNSSYGFRSLMGGIARTYDRLAASDVLSPADRKVVQRAIIPRVEQFIEWYHRDGRLLWPYHSHANHALFMLAELSVAFAGDIPEAADWLEFASYMITANYPNWGRSDGSWSEGPYYWSISLNYHVSSLWALCRILDINILSHPFLTNTGTYMLYLQAPWSTAPAYFGDTRISATSSSQGSILRRLAPLMDNPHFLWHADRVGGSDDDLFMWNPAIEPLPPDDLPLASVFPDTGLTVLRTSLTQREEDIQFALSSNPFGSVSHSWADQGSFTLDVFGEPLIVGSGYYPKEWADRHHSLWSWQSWAHNVPLVDGKGQASRTAEAAGQVERFFHAPAVSYVRVDASRAYQVPTGEAEHLDGLEKGISERIGNLPVESYRRSALFMRPRAIILFDDLMASREVSFDWMLHSMKRMDLLPNENALVICGKEARVKVSLLADGPVDLRQNNAYRIPYTDIQVPPTPAWHDTPEQWHLQATLPGKSRHHRLISVLLPHRPEEPLPEISAVSAASWKGVDLQWSGATGFVGFVAGKNHPATITRSFGSVFIEADARVLAMHGTDRETWLYAADLTSLEITGSHENTSTGSGFPKGRWAASDPVDVVLTVTGSSVSWQIIGAKETRWRDARGAD